MKRLSKRKSQKRQVEKTNRHSGRSHRNINIHSMKTREVEKLMKKNINDTITVHLCNLKENGKFQKNTKRISTHSSRKRERTKNHRKPKQMECYTHWLYGVWHRRAENQHGKEIQRFTSNQSNSSNNNDKYKEKKGIW